MFDQWLLDFTAWSVGLSQPQLLTIEDAAPNTKKLIDLVKTNEVLIKQFAALVPQVTAEVKAIAPAADILLDLIARQKAAKGV